MNNKKTWRKGHNRFFLGARVVGGRKKGLGTGRRNGPKMYSRMNK
jgi:hypothetical protein